MRVDDGHWHQVELVRASGVTTLYLDGAPAGPSTWSTVAPLTPAGALSIGQQGTLGRPFHGSIGQVALYTSPLSAATIAARTLAAGYGGYSATVRATAGLSDYWRVSSSGTSLTNWAAGGSATFANPPAAWFAGALRADPDTSTLFNGSSDFLSTSGTDLTSGNWSMEAWVDPSGTISGRQAIFGSATGGYGLELIAVSGSWHLSATVTGLGDASASSSIEVPPGSFSAVMATYTASSNTVAYYVDGVAAGTANLTVAPTTGVTTNRIGASAAYAAPFAGAIDEPALYHVALAGSVAAAHHLAGAGAAPLAALARPTAGPTYTSNYTLATYAFLATASRGTVPYSYTWSGPGGWSASGRTASHTFACTDLPVNVTLTVSDGASGSAISPVLLAACPTENQVAPLIDTGIGDNPSLVSDGSGTYVYVADELGVARYTIATGTLTRIESYADTCGSVTNNSRVDGITYSSADSKLYIICYGSTSSPIMSFSTAGGAVTTVAEAGPFDSAIAADGAGNLYYNDGLSGQYVVHQRTAAGVVSGFAGTLGTAGCLDGPYGTGRLNLAQGLAWTGGNLYFGDYISFALRHSSGPTNLTSLAGDCASSGQLDGTGAAARLGKTAGLTTDGTYLYQSDANGYIRRITIASGVVVTIANPGFPFYANNLTIVNGTLYIGAPNAIYSLPNADTLGLPGALVVTQVSAAAVNPTYAGNYSSATYHPVIANPRGGVGPYTYAWSGPGGFTSTTQSPTHTFACTALPGILSLTTTDSKGQATTSSTTLPACPSPVGGNAAALSGPTYAGNYTTAAYTFGSTNTGGTGPYILAWSGPGSWAAVGGSASHAFACADLSSGGTVSLNIADTNGQSVDATVSLTACPSAIGGAAASLSGGPLYSANYTIATDTFAAAAASGGAAPYTYAWTGPGAWTDSGQAPSTTFSCSTLPGTATLTVSDAHGQSLTHTVTLAACPGSLSGTASAAAPSYAGNYTSATSIFAGSASGGITPYTYAWSGPGSWTAATASPTHLFACSVLSGTASLTVTDANGQQVTHTVSLTACPSPLSASAAAGTPTYASNYTSASYNFSGPTSGGITAYQWAWSGPGSFSATTQNPSHTFACSTLPGTASLSVTDANGQSTTATANLAACPSPLSSSASISSGPLYSVNYSLAADTFAASAPSGGTAPYTYAWTGPGSWAATGATPSTTFTCSDIGSGATVSLSVTDAHGQVSSASHVSLVACPSPVGGTASVSAPTYAGNYATATYTMTGTTSGGSGSYTSTVWTGPAPLPNNTLSPSITFACTDLVGGKTVTLTITDSVGQVATRNAALASCPSALLAPTGFAQVIGTTTTTTIPVTWNAVTGATSYTLTYGSIPTVVPGLTGTSYPITGLPSNTVLTGAYLVAVSPGGSSPSSSPVTLTSLPGQVGGIGTSAVTTGGVTVSWSTLSGAAATYAVYDGSGNPKASGVSGSSTVISGLSANTAYSGWTIKATNAAGTGAASATFGFTTLPNAPTGPTVGTLTAHTAALSWTASSGGATSYTVYTSTGTAVSGCTTTGTSCTASGLSASTLYSAWYIVASNAGGLSAHSSVFANFTTPVPDFPVVQGFTTGFDSGNVSSHPITYPSGIVAGDLILIVFANGIATSGETPPSGFSQIASDYQSYYRVCVAYKFATGGETSGTYYTTQGQRGSWIVYRISGAANIAISTVVKNTNANPDPGPLTSGFGAVNTLWIAAYGGSQSATAFPASYTAGHTAISGSSRVASAQRNLNATSENPGIFTTSPSGDWVAWTIAIAPAP